MKRSITLSIVFFWIVVSGVFAQNPTSKAEVLEEIKSLKAGSFDLPFPDHSAAMKQSVNIADDFGEAPAVDWMESFGGSGTDVVRCLIADGPHYYIALDFCGTMDFSGTTFTATGSRDVIFAKINNTGSIIWSMQAHSGAHQNCIAYDMQLNQGKLYITGYFDGETFSAGNSTLNLIGEEDMFYLKLSVEGQVEMLKNFGSNGDSYRGLAIALDSGLNIYLAGTTNGSINYIHPSFLARINQSGDVEWWQEHDLAFNDLAIHNNNLYVAGTVYDPYNLGGIPLSPPPYSDVFAAKADLEGNYEWAVQGEHETGEWGDSYMPQIRTGSNGDLYMSGNYRDYVRFGDFLLNGTYPDVFVVKINENGSVLWANSTFSAGGELGAMTLLADDRTCFSGKKGGTMSIDDLELGYYDGFYYAILDNSGVAQQLKVCDLNAKRIAGGLTNDITITGTKLMDAGIMNYNSAGAATIVAVGAGNSGVAEVVGTETDEDGNIYSVSNVMGFTNFYGHQFSSEENMVLLASQNADGEVLWTETITGADALNSYGGTLLKLDEDNQHIFFHGSFEGIMQIGDQQFFAGVSRPYLCCFGMDGEFLWIKILPDQTKEGYAIDTDEQGNVYFAFDFWGTIELEGQIFSSYGSQDMLVAKYSAAGELMQVSQISSDHAFYSSALAVMSSGAYYVTVEPMMDTVIFDGGNTKLILTPHDGRSIVAKYDEQNNFVWAKSYGYSSMSYGGYYCWATAALHDEDGNLYLTGTHGDSAMFGNIMLRSPYYHYSPYNAKIDPDGNVLWAHSIQSCRWGQNYCEADLDEEGNLYCMGTIIDTVYFGDWQYIPTGAREIYIASYHTEGALRWVKTSKGTSGYQYPASIAVKQKDDLFVGARFSVDLKMDESIVYSSASESGLIISLNNSIGIDEHFTVIQQGFNFSVTPNPSDGRVDLIFDGYQQSMDISVTDLTGKTILKCSRKNVEKQVALDLKNLNAGVYLIRVETGREEGVRKLIVK